MVETFDFDSTSSGAGQALGVVICDEIVATTSLSLAEQFRSYSIFPDLGVSKPGSNTPVKSLSCLQVQQRHGRQRR